MAKQTQTKRGKPVEVTEVRCTMCRHLQRVKVGTAIPSCERCGSDLQVT